MQNSAQTVTQAQDQTGDPGDALNQKLKIHLFAQAYNCS